MVSGRLALHIIQSKAIAFPLLNLRQFRFRIKFFPGELLGALQRCNAVVGPYSLKVGLTAGRTWHGPTLLTYRRSDARLCGRTRLGLRRNECRGAQDLRNHERYNAQGETTPITDWNLLDYSVAALDTG